MVRFQCKLEGLCCKKYWIPITHLDLLRLHIYDGFSVEQLVDVIDFYPAEALTEERYKPIKTGAIYQYLALKSRDDGGCIFLSPKGLCTVHLFKPLVCRFYPFVYWIRDDGEIDVDIYDKALEECPGLEEKEDRTIPPAIKESLKRLARIRLREIELWNQVANEWNSSDDSTNFSEYKLVVFLLDRAKKHRELLEKEGLWTM